MLVMLQAKRNHYTQWRSLAKKLGGATKSLKLIHKILPFNKIKMLSLVILAIVLVLDNLNRGLKQLNNCTWAITQQLILFLSSVVFIVSLSLSLKHNSTKLFLASSLSLSLSLSLSHIRSLPPQKNEDRFSSLHQNNPTHKDRFCMCLEFAKGSKA
ncbi:hypothetical protein RIF29_21515 [Crotalaria pallida]|uniref:Transmembrane protein n=1 Tax=Crotalaria pallida TaxID=3830 RepID=A0AAN9F4P7_CROPI